MNEVGSSLSLTGTLKAVVSSNCKRDLRHFLQRSSVLQLVTFIEHDICAPLITSREVISDELLRAPARKNQISSKMWGKGGKFDFFHISMLDRVGYY